MLSRYTIVLLLFIGNMVLAQPDSSQSAFSLDQAIEFAFNNNVEVQNAQLGIEQARRNVKEQTAQGLPQMNGKIEYTNFPALPVSLIPAEFLGGQKGEFEEIRFGTEHNLSATVSLSQMIFDGRFFNGLQAAKVAVDLSRKQYDLSKVEVRYIITKAYYNALISRQYVGILEESIGSAEKLYNDTKAMYENGFVESIEVDRLMLALTNIRTRLNSVKRQSTLAEGLLKFQMGYDITRPITLTDSLDSKTIADHSLLNKEVSPSNRTDYQLLETQQLLRETYLKTIRSGYYPTANLFGNVEETAQRNEFNFFDFEKDWYATVLWGVTINIPIWDSFRKHNSIQEEKLNIETIRNRKSNMQQAIQLELMQNQTAYANALESFEAQKENLELAERIFNVATAKYNEGVGSSLEVESAQSSLYQTQLSYINALMDLVQAKADLKKTLEQ